MNAVRKRTHVASDSLDGRTAATAERPKTGDNDLVDGKVTRTTSGQVRDLGWNEKPENVHPGLAPGMDNDRLWLLLRRFDKEIFLLREASEPGARGELDLHLAEGARFSATKLRSQLERLYMGALLGSFAGVKHLSRLHSWLEPRRTAAFATSYFLAWHFDALFTLALTVVICMVLSLRLRRALFPPVPIALVDWKTGELSKPTAGVLGSVDAATGAPETFRGEAVEKEAANFASSLAGIAVEMWTAQDQKDEPSNLEEDGQPADSLPQPHEPSNIIAMAQDKSSGVQNPAHDKTKRPMQAAMWSGMLPLLRALYSISDTWERLANALNSTPPFPNLDHRLRLAGLLAPLWLASVLVSPYHVVKILTLSIGLGLFGRPLLVRASQWLDRVYSGWRYMLYPEHNILRGIPTNAQLTITILRNNERLNAPIPPPPSINRTPPMKPVRPSSEIADMETLDKPLGADEAELAEAAAPDPSILDDAGGRCSKVEATEGSKPHRLLHLLGHLKRGIRSTVHVAQQADRLRAKAGRESAKNRVGVLPCKSDDTGTQQGPSTFRARNEAKEGQVHISAEGIVSFDEQWSVHVSDITELKKHSGLGLKTKLVVSWAMDLDVKDGLEIKDRAGNAYVLTAVTHRDQLFDRLCAMGGQVWDVW